ncbi:MAG: TlyA family RNA methyltransferase [Clostridiales bacterium]|nr:TlyA family RNA methyltransferase [Eubacteriales bacterium]MDH7565224.1 TlyA family RNA methyltransferase [Clostridiales bacterium]
MQKQRLDVLLVDRGYFKSREKARTAIMAGTVFVNKVREDKPGANFPEDCEIEIKENINPYVSRGGLKLEKALKTFNLDLRGKTAIDVGASTGGFTDCMLKNGAARVFAVDVGYGQLAWELRQDARVVCMERTNIRYVKPSHIGVLADFSTVDVSFISLKKVLPVVKELLTEKGEVVCLVKPQFEAGREKVGKKGVVREPAVHIEVLGSITAFALENGFKIRGITYSPVKGPEGNIEYLVHLAKTGESVEKLEKSIDTVVAEAHNSLK